MSRALSLTICLHHVAINTATFATRFPCAQAKAKWAFGDEGRAGCPPGSDVDLRLELKRVKAVKTIDPDHTGAITKTIVRDGAAYHTPNDYATATVSWEGKLADGTQFDAVRARAALCCTALRCVCARADLQSDVCATRIQL